MRRHDDNDQQRLTESRLAPGGIRSPTNPWRTTWRSTNWSQYDDPSTFTKFTKFASRSEGRDDHPRDLLFQQRRTSWPSCTRAVPVTTSSCPARNAVAELIQEKGLLALDKALLPNLKYLDPSFLKPSYDPDG